MNKTININLGGFPFTVDDEAFQVLKDYIDRVENYFRNSEGSEEITADIEYRLAELIRSRMGSRKIVMTSDVKSSIQILGTPEMFGEETYTEGTESENKSGTFEDFQTSEKESYSTGKRLFRNPDNQIIAGVCSGLGAYFGIHDPVWIRLFFVLTVISGGMGFIAYIVMWAIIPEAKNSADRLAMKGKSINISNIAKEVESQINNLSKKISSLGKTKTPASSSGFDNFENDTFKDLAGDAENLGQRLGDFIRVLALGSLKTLKSIGRVTAIFILIVLGLLWFGALFSVFYSKSWLMMVLPFGTLGSLSYSFMGLLLVFIPLIVIGLWLAGVFKYRTKGKRILRYSALVWFLALFITAFSTTAWIKNYRTEGSIVQNKSYHFDSDSIILKPSDFNLSGSRISFGRIAFVDNAFASDKIQINLSISKDDQVHISKTVRSSGKNKKEARRFAGLAEYTYTISDNTIEFDNEFKIPADGKIRNQKIILDIEIPEGMHININQSLLRFIDRVKLANEGKLTSGDNNTHRLTATKTGFIYR